MQFPESWLRALVDPPLSTTELCNLLTMAGLEVEECRPASAEFSQVVVARILSAEKHPDADRLKLCRVDAGQHGVLQIVCGAPNAAAGLVVPCALVGAKLPGLEIKKAKVRGIESFGMLCSKRELGLADDHGGLMVLPEAAPIGEDLREYLNLDDTLITLKLTPNRADCLSLVGIAREVAALTGAPLSLPVSEPIAPVHDERRRVVLDAPAACPRYCGRIVRGVDAKAPTPEWMKQRIERCGVRSISALVDITNYVMLELGQPLHAFDDAELSGAIHVRYPRPSEQLLLLNGQTVTPSAETALIADDEKALALAGIMGGEHSGIRESTTDLFLESAFFTPAAIAGKARALGFSTDASYRYERGVDFELQRKAIERATQLIVAICGGHPGPIVEAVAPEQLPTRPPVVLRMPRVAQVLGVDLGDSRIEALIRGLGFPFERRGDVLTVSPPSWRFDIAIEEDLIEEIARLHGYDNIPAPPPQARLAMLPLPETRRTPMQVRRLLAERGYHEVVTYSFVPAEWEADFAANAQPVRLANPIASQMGVMRSSLIGGLVGVLAGNLKRQIERVRVFELGRVFFADAQAETGYRQPQRLAFLAAGPVVPEQWGVPRREVDFYDVKGDLEALCAPRRLQFVRSDHPALHPGRSSRVLLDGREVGVLGELHPRWVQRYELGRPPVLCEIELELLLEAPLPSYAEVSRFPAVQRDIALVVPQSCAADELTAALWSAAGDSVREIRLFDVYQGKGIAVGCKSLAFRILMQDTRRTLSDSEADQVIDRLLAAARERCGAVLRS
ncbi:phenylalanine--tRNA ligase subunit beta [Sulfuricystis thermophila]|uniref:phenylalanine--tRNA ligase subunit beta n=1 Tax=Sulfuricystis thermophila TaxID=2496847 RepID=UPI0010364920|nr:phenylalanine--tRNA ligase subunit beta [Sulfuricystis thermophila]